MIEGLRPHPLPQTAQETARRREMVMLHLADDDQGGQGVAHHRQAEVPEKALGQSRELEGQRRDPPKGIGQRTQAAGQRAHGEDRNGKGTVLAIDRRDRGLELLGFDRADLAADPVASPLDDRTVVVPGSGSGAQGRPAQGGGARIAGASRRVAPAPVGIDVGRQPVEAAAGETLIGDGKAATGALHRDEREGRGGGRQRARRKLSPEMTRGAELGHKPRAGVPERFPET